MLMLQYLKKNKISPALYLYFEFKINFFYYLFLHYEKLNVTVNYVVSILFLWIFLLQGHQIFGGACQKLGSYGKTFIGPQGMAFLSVLAGAMGAR